VGALPCPYAINNIEVGKAWTLLWPLKCVCRYDEEGYLVIPNVIFDVNCEGASILSLDKENLLPP
jgi:hypothetical protein